MTLTSVKYDDIFVRDDLSDQGNVPYEGNILYRAPDIVPYGPNPLTNYKQELVTQYANDSLAGNIEHGEYNYIYVRGKNLGSSDRTGSVNLYYVQSSLVTNVDKWKQIKYENTKPGVSISAAAGKAAAGDDAFHWNAPNPDPGYHFCLIAQVVTPQHPDAIPKKITNYAEYVKWVRDHPGVAMRNVQVVDKFPDPTQQWKMDLDNLETTERVFLINVQCDGCPVDGTIHIVCQAMDPPVDQLTKIKNKKEQFISATGKIKGGHSAVTIVTYNAKDPKNPGIVIVTQAFTLTDPSELELYPYGKTAEYYGFTNEEAGISDEDQRLVLLGDYSVEFRSK